MTNKTPLNPTAKQTQISIYQTHPNNTEKENKNASHSLSKVQATKTKQTGNESKQAINSKPVAANLNPTHLISDNVNQLNKLNTKSVNSILYKNIRSANPNHEHPRCRQL